VEAKGLAIAAETKRRRRKKKMQTQWQIMTYQIKNNYSKKRKNLFPLDTEQLPPNQWQRGD
jgi:hypothetical protein